MREEYREIFQFNGRGTPNTADIGGEVVAIRFLSHILALIIIFLLFFCPYFWVSSSVHDEGICCALSLAGI